VGSILVCISVGGPLELLERCEYLRFWNQFHTCACGRIEMRRRILPPGKGEGKEEEGGKP
jgi:hypothetical protein